MGEAIKMRNYKFLLIMLVTSMLCISFSAVSGIQIPEFSGEKLKINDPLKITNPLIINRFEGFFQSIINHFINIIPTFIMAMFNTNNRDVEIDNDIDDLDTEDIIVKDNIANNIEKITINNKGEEAIDTYDEIIDIENSEDEIINEDNIGNDDNEDSEEEFDFEHENGEGLELSLELDEVFEFGGPIQVNAILTNYGDKTVFLCEMDVKLRTLDFEIETPDGSFVHYIEPFEGKAKAVRLDPYESISSKINLTSSNVTFGVTKTGPSGIQSPFKFNPGSYTITGLYISYQAITAESATYWQGVLYSPNYNFSIKSVLTFSN